MMISGLSILWRICVVLSTIARALPGEGFRFYAVPPRIVYGASFPVRAFAEVDE